LDTDDFNISNKYTPTILPSEHLTKKDSFFSKNTPASKSIVSISENIRQIYKHIERQNKDVTRGSKRVNANLTISPCFQCYTALPFHGALLKELQTMVKRIDSG